MVRGADFFFFSPFPQIISHQREHNGPVENNLPPSATVALAMSDTIGGRELWQSLRIVLTLQPHVPELVQQVLLVQFLFFLLFLLGTLEVITVTWPLANATEKNKQPPAEKFPWLSSECTYCIRLSRFRCHSVVATHQKHMASTTACLLSF